MANSWRRIGSPGPRPAAPIICTAPSGRLSTSKRLPRPQTTEKEFQPQEGCRPGMQQRHLSSLPTGLPVIPLLRRRWPRRGPPEQLRPGHACAVDRLNPSQRGPAPRNSGEFLSEPGQGLCSLCSFQGWGVEGGWLMLERGALVLGSLWRPRKGGAEKGKGSQRSERERQRQWRLEGEQGRSRFRESMRTTSDRPNAKRTGSCRP